MLKGLSNKHFLFSFLILAFTTHSLCALSSNDTHSPISSKTISFLSQLHPVFTLTTGAFISKLGQSQAFTPLDLCSYSYKSNNSNTTTMLWGGFVGSEVKHTPTWNFIAGLGYYQPNTLSTKGALTQGADPASDDTYRYRYHTQSQ